MSCLKILKLGGDSVIEFFFFKSMQYYGFYHGNWKDQRDATVIILRYTMLRHNGLHVWEVIHTSPLGIIWKKSVHLKLKIMSITCKFNVFDLVLTL